MRKALLAGLLLIFALPLACGGDDGASRGGDPEVTLLPENTLGYIDGTEDGQIKYPTIELWGVPECSDRTLITNTPHETRVRIHAKKAKCNQPMYEVEILEGPKAGKRGWVFDYLIRFDPGTEPSS
jgi:hypothetical protein